MTSGGASYKLGSRPDHFCSGPTTQHQEVKKGKTKISTEIFNLFNNNDICLLHMTIRY